MQETIAAFAEAGLARHGDHHDRRRPGQRRPRAAARRRRRRRQRAGRRHPRRQGSRRRCRVIAPSNDPRWERLRKAVALEPVDKVPVCLEGVAWSARVTGMTLEEFLSDPNKATQAEIDSFKLVGNADCVNNPTLRLGDAQLHVDDGRQASRLRARPRRAVAGRGVRTHDARGLRHDPRGGLAGVPGAVPERAHPPRPARGVHRVPRRRAPRSSSRSPRPTCPTCASR